MGHHRCQRVTAFPVSYRGWAVTAWQYSPCCVSRVQLSAAQVVPFKTKPAELEWVNARAEGLEQCLGSPQLHILLKLQ